LWSAAYVLHPIAKTEEMCTVFMLLLAVVVGVAVAAVLKTFIPYSTMILFSLTPYFFKNCK
jgi:hypothetical protein